MNDLLLDDNGDLNIVDDDLDIGFSDLQHQEHLLVAQKGSVKEFPDVGVGIEDAINDSEIEQMLTDINAEFTKDGMEVRRLNYDEQTGELDYDAEYKS